MNLKQICERTVPAAPWAEGDNIPWDDPEFSERMLAEHLSQEHDLASRRSHTIEAQVGWIHEEILGSRPARILDLGCGPGLYTRMLAGLGHDCEGIDFSPASIRHAREAADDRVTSCTYRLEDLREAELGADYGLVMMLFGQLNVFRREEARGILGRAHAALAPGGLLLLEPQRRATVEEAGRGGCSWYACGEGGGLFSSRAHLCLTEPAWDGEAESATLRFFVIDAETAEVTRHAMTTEAYSDEQYRELLADVGFGEIRLFPSLVGVEVDDPSQSANLAIVGRKE